MTQVSLSGFDEAKAAQVAFFFLSKAKESGKHITKLRFIKWVYLAERLAYQKLGEPLVGDRMCSMRHGPVLSNILYIIENPQKAKGVQGYWDSVVNIEKIHTRQYLSISNQCSFKKTDDLRALSDAQIDLLETVWKKYGKMNSKELETILHNSEIFPEWQWNEGDGSNPIELESLFSILGYTENQTNALIQNIQANEHLDQAFKH